MQENDTKCLYSQTQKGNNKFLLFYSTVVVTKQNFTKSTQLTTKMGCLRIVLKNS